MITDKQKDKLISIYRQQLPNDYDKGDIESDIDSSLTYNENFNMIMEKVEEIKGKQFDAEEYEEAARQLVKSQNPVDDELKEAVNKSNALVILGSKRSGKTALSYTTLLKSEKDKYVFKHPKPYLLNKLGIKNLFDFADVVKLEDATIYFDEPQLSLPLNAKKNRQILQILLTLSSHRNLTFIFSTSDTRYFTYAEEDFIDTWLIKDLNYSRVKRNSIAKSVIEDYEKINPNAFSLDKSDFILYNRNLKYLNGLHSFNLPDWWTEQISKPFSSKLFLENKKKIIELTKSHEA